MRVIARLIKHGNIYHAIVLDAQGRYHHEQFTSEENALSYLEGYYHDHRRIVAYTV